MFQGTWLERQVDSELQVIYGEEIVPLVKLVWDYCSSMVELEKVVTNGEEGPSLETSERLEVVEGDCSFSKDEQKLEDIVVEVMNWMKDHLESWRGRDEYCKFCNMSLKELRDECRDWRLAVSETKSKQIVKLSQACKEQMKMEEWSTRNGSVAGR